MNFFPRSTTSADGTIVEYLSAGHGPGVIIAPGALAEARDLTSLASLLAASHAVHIVQRRGRGGSGPQGDHYAIERECEDIEAVRAATGARLLFGHSFGGFVALRAACGNPAFDAIAVYEPGVSVDGSIPMGWIERARREIATGDAFGAFITFVQGINPRQTGRVPRRLLGMILRRAIPRDELRQNLALMPQAILEHAEVGRLDGRLTDYAAVQAPTMIMRGRGRGTSPQAIGLSRLAETIPNAEVVVFGALDHFAPEKRPGEIACAVLSFFAAHSRPRTTTAQAT